MKGLREKLRSREGKISRLAGILLVLIAILCVIIAIPSWKIFRFRSEKTACIQAIKSAEDGLIIEFLSRMETESVEEARRTLDEVLPERPNICPSGGTVYLIEGENGIYKPVCGLHDSDLAERCRLNASMAKELVNEVILLSRIRDEEIPDPLVITLNGQELECAHVLEEEPLHRGTKTSLGYEGTMCFYGLDGEGSFSSKNVAKGELCYLLYADEETCALWRADDGWTGLAYEGVR